MKDDKGPLQPVRRAIIESLICDVFSVMRCPAFERVFEGVSTEVYRIWHENSVFYLRILPEPDATFTPEVLVHQLLRARNIHVPEVIYFVPCYPPLQLSVMVTTAIPGIAVGFDNKPRDMQQVFVAAGQELAVINSIPVDGFGWLRRQGPESKVLEAVFPTQADFVHHHVGESLRVVSTTTILQSHEVQAIADYIHNGVSLKSDHAYLAHGDFEVTHIYHEGGAYGGIIDFSAVRGTDPYFDLGYFNYDTSDGLPFLLEGYRMVAPLADDYEERIAFWTLLLALRRVGRSIEDSGPAGVRPHDVMVMRKHLKELVY
jgi:fructosamine-3-kinase